MYTRVKTPKEIESMRRAGQILGAVLQILEDSVVVGMDTAQIDDIAKKEVLVRGGKSAFLGYQGFAGSICTSVNDAVVHGIPSKKIVLKNGDVIGLDLGVAYDNMIVDGAISLIVGESTKENAKLLEVTKRALNEGIKQVKDGCTTGDIGEAIERVLKADSYGIVRDLVGHGVGHEVHEDPNIPNFGKKGSGSILKAGMTIAIEPMANLGGEKVYIDSDGWTVRTEDGSVSAHFEHTVLVTDNGFEILTLAS